MENKLYPLTEKELEIINEARQEEINASSWWLYLCFCLGNAGFINASEWAYQQSKEERYHFKKLSDYLLTRGVEPEMPEIAMPNIEFTDLKSGILAASNRESILTEMYDEWIDDLNAAPKVNMTIQVFREMLDIQKYSIQSMRDLLSQIEGRESREDQLEFDLQYFGPKTPESAVG